MTPLYGTSNISFDIKIKGLGIFSVRRCFGEFFQATTNRDLAFVTVPFPCYDDIYDTYATPCMHVLRSAKQKRQVNTIDEGISQI